MQPTKWNSKAKRMGKRLTMREKLSFLQHYEAEMSRGRNREQILGRMAQKIGVSSNRQVERIIAQAKSYREEIEEHFAQLDITRIALVDNYKKWRENPVVNLSIGRIEGAPVYPIGDLIYGGSIYEISSLGTGQFCQLLDVDNRTAKNLLTHLKKEFPELADLKDFADLLDDRSSRKIISLIQSYRGRYKGNCPDCPPS